MCLWPCRASAVEAADNAFPGLAPRAIGWDEWLSSWVPWLEEWGQRLVAPWPSATTSGATLDIADLAAAVAAARAAR